MCAVQRLDGSCLITLCITFYSMLLLLSCTNYELRPRFLQGFSILISGLVLSGSFMAIPCVVALIFSQVTKTRRKDLWMHLDSICYTCIFFVFPTFVFTLSLWGSSKVLKDVMESGHNIITYEGSCVQPFVIGMTISAVILQ